MAAAQVRIVSEDEYLTERLELLKKEKELTRAQDELKKQRQALPIIPVKQSYAFTDIDEHGNKITKSLLDLFDGRDQLIICHFMFEPSSDAGCPMCTLGAESMSPALPHLNSRSVTLVNVSLAPIEKIAAYKKRLGFTFPWVSSFDTPFNRDYHVTMSKDHPDDQYNFASRDSYIARGMFWGVNGEQPGYSCFIQGNSKKGIGEDGTVYHTYSCYARGGDGMSPTFAWLDLTKLGRRDDVSNKLGIGFRRHDEYSEDELKGVWREK